MSSIDWSAWSREAVAEMQRRNESWKESFRLDNSAYQWSLDPPTIWFSRNTDYVIADLCFIGSVSNSTRTFLWSWANDQLPGNSITGIEAVREFGVEHDLPLLTTSEIEANRPEGLEIVAIAGRIQNASSSTTRKIRLFSLHYTILE